MNDGGAELARSLHERHAKRPWIPLALAALCATLACGLVMPLLRIEKMVFWENEYSVATGVFGLFEDGQWVLAAVVFFWSVIFPIAKLVLLAWIWFGRVDDGQRGAVLARLEKLGKWSMLDVFIVAVLIVAAKLGPIADVAPQPGIYVFGVAVLGSMWITGKIVELAREPS